ncbi:unnamed protein product [Dicrocoelium dendriticum]|nr:unnamed protein product [Dicrocoelium dendriticum]
MERWRRMCMEEDRLDKMDLLLSLKLMEGGRHRKAKGLELSQEVVVFIPHVGCDPFIAPVVNEDSLSTAPMCELSDCHHNSEEELSFGFYLNSGLPPVDNVAPFSPLYASSPRALLDEISCTLNLFNC